jgi:hypothetical protein
MDRLRSVPVQSAPELARAIKRLDEVRELAKGLPRTDKLPKTRILAPRAGAGGTRPDHQDALHAALYR